MPLLGSSWPFSAGKISPFSRVLVPSPPTPKGSGRGTESGIGQFFGTSRISSSMVYSPIHAPGAAICHTLTQTAVGINALAVVCLFPDKSLILEYLTCDCSACYEHIRGADRVENRDKLCISSSLGA
jgi:hypothetical protein